MTIGELSRRSGLATSCLRYYERVGLIPRPPRVSGRRVFDEDLLPKLAIIRAASRAGFSLAEIRDLLRYSKAWPTAVRQKIDDLDAEVARLELVKEMLREALRCGCVEDELCPGFYAFASLDKRRNQAAKVNRAVR